MRGSSVRLALPLVAALAAAPAAAHDGVVHATPAEAATHQAAAAPELPFPLAIRPRFALTDQTGRAVTEADFAGRPMAVFFGYASCESICTVALPAIGAALEILGPEAAGIAALMITVDPERDTPEAMARKLPDYSPRLIGLTGSEAALAEARAAFQVEFSEVARLPDGSPVYAHGSFVYLVGRDGLVKSVLPPILAPERIAELMAKTL